MPRSPQSREKRTSLLPVVARVFAELGYRRTTTAELARRCGVRENILYRLWPDKKAMFIAAIGYVYDLSAATWARLLRGDGTDRSPAERILAYESKHCGEFGHYRIVFAGLSETDDPDIRKALSDMYRHFHLFIGGQIQAYRSSPRTRGTQSELLAWAVIGLGTVANIGRELGLVSDRSRSALIRRVGKTLLEATVT